MCKIATLQNCKSSVRGTTSSNIFPDIRKIAFYLLICVKKLCKAGVYLFNKINYFTLTVIEANIQMKTNWTE